MQQYYNVNVTMQQCYSECDEDVQLQGQGNTELWEKKKLFQYHRYKIEEYELWRKNWGLIIQIQKTAELLQKILDVDLNLFSNFRV